MIALYIFLFLLLLIFLFLIAPFHITFSYHEKARVRIRTLFLSFDAIRLFERISSASSQKSPKKKEEKPPEQEKKTRRKRSASPLGFVEFLGRITRILTEAVRDLLSKMHIRLKELYVSVSASDAAKTALCYGAAVQAGYALLAVLQRFTHFSSSDRLYLSPSFTGENTRFSICLDISVRPIQCIPIFLRTYLKLQERKDEKNERNPVEASH